MTGAQLKAIRTKLGCTGEEFARALGYGGSPQNLKSMTSQFELGRRPVPNDVSRLAVMLGRHGIPDEPWFAGDTLTRLVAMFRHHGVPAERSFSGGATAAETSGRVASDGSR